MKLKQWQNIFDFIINGRLIVQHIVQNKNEIIKHVNVNIEIIISAEKIIVRILVHVSLRIVST